VVGFANRLRKQLFFNCPKIASMGFSNKCTNSAIFCQLFHWIKKKRVYRIQSSIEDIFIGPEVYKQILLHY